ncbi:MAG: SDR family oxidoreductase [Actinomycetes bacterium]
MSDKSSFHGQVVMVVGAGNGIGRATIGLLKGRGARVIALDMNSEALSALQNEFSLGVDQVKVLDVSDEAAIVKTIAEINNAEGRIDALVNSAGMTGPTNRPINTISWVEFEKTLRVNLFGAIWLTQNVIPIMQKQKYGRIVHVSSIAGKEGNPGMAPYNTSKAGMIGFIKGVAKEVAPEGITINAVAPAVIRTPMNADTSDETLKYMIARIPMGRVGEAEEVAETICFAASKACSFTTGFTFDTSGGRATY